MSSFPARRAQESSPVRQHWENDGPASAPERGGRNRAAVLLSPRSGAAKRRPPATHGSAPWATILRPSGSAQLPTKVGPRNAAAQAGDRRREPLFYSEFVRKNSLVTSFQLRSEERRVGKECRS